MTVSSILGFADLNRMDRALFFERDRMHRIIDGKNYDTETADCIATWSINNDPDDFDYCEESLYRTRKGSWFICGAGGPYSKYGRPAGACGLSGGDELAPISTQQAMEWLKEHAFTAELQKHFSGNL